MFSSFTTRDRLRRSISTRSIRKIPRPEVGIIDPDVAKAHAAAAASKAMRSSERSSTESKSPYARLGGPSQVAVPRRRPNSSLQGTDDGFSISSSSAMPPVPPVTPRQSMERGPQPHVSGVPKAALPPPSTDFKGLDGRDSSVPSSYRRLRKAKSMFSTRQRSSHIIYSASPKSPKSPRHAIDLDRSPGFELPRTLRPSISFIRGGNRPRSRGIRHAKSHDAAIQLARSQFLDESKGADPVRRSSFFMSRNKREPKPFRKTFRVTSDAGIGAVSPEQANFKRSQTKSRIFSASFKEGLKRVFGLSKPAGQKFQLQDEDEDTPIVFQKSTVKARPVSIAPDESVSIKHWNGSNQLHPTQVSPSHDSTCTSASRVTSWADSSVANTVTNRKTGHRQSLSLIEEHGDLNQPLPRMPTHAIAGNLSPSKIPSAQRLDPWVNSHDLYTALMQQIGRDAVHNPEEEITFGTVPEHRVIPERTNLYPSKRSVRRVTSGDSSPVSFATAHRGDSQSPRRQPRSHKYIQPARVAQYSPIIGEQSDESTGSVVVTNCEDTDRLSRSSSVYSRSTGGRNLTEDIDTDEECLDTYDEPGTVTIYPPERHSSPTRISGTTISGSQVQPSADWQQWMNSQIGRIETTSPTREHFRETAQYQDDDEFFMGMTRRAPGPSSESTVTPYVEEPDEPVCMEPRAPTELKTLVQNNFSRPFSRSSSVRTIVSSQNIKPAFTEIEYVNPSDAHVNAKQAENAVPKLGELPNRSSLSPVRMRIANMRETPDSPTPRRDGAGSQKRTWTQEQYRRYSARRPIANGRPSSFRSMRTYRDFRGLNNENARQQEEHDEMMGEYHKLQDTHSTISSKDMVDIFLSSRRCPDGAETSDDKAEIFL